MQDFKTIFHVQRWHKNAAKQLLISFRATIYADQLSTFQSKDLNHAPSNMD